jgi:hypothetical protein
MLSTLMIISLDQGKLNPMSRSRGAFDVKLDGDIASARARSAQGEAAGRRPALQRPAKLLDQLSIMFHRTRTA